MQRKKEIQITVASRVKFDKIISKLEYLEQNGILNTLKNL